MTKIWCISPDIISVQLHCIVWSQKKKAENYLPSKLTKVSITCFANKRKGNQIYQKEKNAEKCQYTNSSAAYVRVRQLSLEITLFSLCSLQVIIAFWFGQLCANLFCSASANRKWKEVWYSGEAAHRAGKPELSPHFVFLLNLAWSIALFWLKIRTTQFLVHPFSKTGAFQ